MKILVRRFEYGDKYTISRLYVDGVYECFVLEDKVREKKIFDKTAIPAGKYIVEVSRSPKFKKDLPRLLNVPNYEGVLIHSGNKSIDTSGCLLTGTTWTGGDFIGNSRVAFSHLFDQILSATLKKEPITIEIQDTLTTPVMRV